MAESGHSVQCSKVKRYAATCGTYFISWNASEFGGVQNFIIQSKFSSFKPVTDIDFKKYTQITQTVSHPNDFWYKATICRTPPNNEPNNKDAGILQPIMHLWLHISLPHANQLIKSACICGWYWTDSSFLSILPLSFSPLSPSLCPGARPALLCQPLWCGGWQALLWYHVDVMLVSCRQRLKYITKYLIMTKEITYVDIEMRLYFPIR